MVIAAEESIISGMINGGTASTVMLHGLNLGEALTGILEGVLGAVFPPSDYHHFGDVYL